MIPNPIRKVLSTFRNCEVLALLMGGQACVFYGAAEFSRDTDFAILADAVNLGRLRHAMEELRAEVIAVPPFELGYLERGHAVHFRCHHPEANGLRIDVMSRMRGVEDFPQLWERRTTLESIEGDRYELLGLSDLVAAKKTQRDKDWPMIRRLIEADMAATQQPTPAQVRFWLAEGRTPSLLVELWRERSAESASAARLRPLLLAAARGDLVALEEGLSLEERIERAADRAYWLPLRRELESFRHGCRPPPPG